MVFLDSVIDYVIQNWLNILFAIILSSIFYLLSVRGIKKIITSRQEERLNIAKESIVDVLENQIINNSDINIDKIIHLLNATSRARGVNLTQEYTPVDILEDVELRFAESKHLKNENREECVKKIENIIKNMEGEQTIIIPSYEKVLATLEESIEKGDPESVKQNLNFLRKELMHRTERIEKTEEMAKMIAFMITLILLLGYSSFKIGIAGYTEFLEKTLIYLVTPFILLILLVIIKKLA